MEVFIRHHRRKKMLKKIKQLIDDNIVIIFFLIISSWGIAFLYYILQTPKQFRSGIYPQMLSIQADAALLAERVEALEKQVQNHHKEFEIFSRPKKKKFIFF